MSASSVFPLRLAHPVKDVGQPLSLFLRIPIASHQVGHELNVFIWDAEFFTKLIHRKRFISMSYYGDFTIKSFSGLLLYHTIIVFPKHSCHYGLVYPKKSIIVRFRPIFQPCRTEFFDIGCAFHFVSPPHIYTQYFGSLLGTQSNL